ncbi:MAG: succinate dehydrogenase [Chloroflexi bacterium]|nr:succinate dehydrogenase [Chloroflexota bacterium]
MTAQRSVELSARSSARARPSGSRRELLSWYLMRLTGVALFVLALTHFSILHFLFDPAEQTAEFIAEERWNRIFWRAFDWLLLMTVLFHGFVGMRTVLLDNIRSERNRVLIVYLLYGLAALVFILGTQVILTLPVRGQGA